MSSNARPYKTTNKHLHNNNNTKGGIIRCCTALCCTCNRLSVDSSTSSSINSNHNHASISSLAHTMVQERLGQMITEANATSAKRREVKRRKGKRPAVTSNGSLVVVMAMEKRSIDPCGDFRKSMEEMIITNRIEETKDLRYLLNCYISMNSKEYRATILEAFYEVCSDMFFSCSL